MAGDRAKERVALERVEPSLAPRPGGCCARDVTEQCDLAEVVARLEHVGYAAVDLDLALAVGDDVEAVAGVALAEARLARLQNDRLEARREQLQRRCGQRLEHLIARTPARLGSRPLDGSSHGGG